MDVVGKAMESRGFTSNDQLAEEVLSEWGEGSVSRRSVGAKIGLLRKGDHKWWLKRPKAIVVLLRLLELDHDDVFVAEPGIWPFEEFPILKGLVRNESPPRHGALWPRRHEGKWAPYPGAAAADCSRRSLFDLPTAGATWIVVPPGAGKSLCCVALNKKMAPCGSNMGPIRAFLSPTLREVLRAADNVPLVVEVVRPSSDPDFNISALRSLAHHPNITILASFERPVHAECGIWEDLEWRAALADRSQLLGWIEHRLEADSLFDAQSAIYALERVDPTGEFITTASDVLWAAAYLHNHSPSLFSLEALVAFRAERLADRESASPLVSHRRRMADCATRLQRARLDSLGASIEEGLSADDWAALVPVELAAESGYRLPEEIGGELVALVEAKTKKERVQIADEVSLRLAAPRPLEFIADAERVGWLRVGKNGGLDVGPCWFAGYVTSRVVEEALRDESLAWGRWCYEARRRLMVDIHLDRLSRADWKELAERVAAAFDERGREFAIVGAIEAVFASLARRADTSVSSTLLKRLLLIQLGVAVRIWEYRPIQPISRGHDAVALDEWVANCWAVSLMLPAPPDAAVSLCPWLFPAWGTGLKTGTEPQWFRQLVVADPREQGTDLVAIKNSQHAHRLLRLAPRLMPHFEIAAESDCPKVLFVEACRLPAGPSKLKLDWHRQPRWVPEWLVHQLQPDIAETQAVMRAVWLAQVAQATSFQELRMIWHDRPELAVLLNSVLQPDDIRAALEAHHQPEGPALRLFAVWLPDELQVAVINWLAEFDPTGLEYEMHSIWNDEIALGRPAFEVLLALPFASWPAANKVWEMFPERAAEMLETLDEGDEGLRLLISSTPDALLQLALHRVERWRGEPYQRWRGWIANRMPSRPDLAERMIALLAKVVAASPSGHA